MLFDPERHETPGSTPWGPSRARAAIQDIVADCGRSRIRDAVWPAHPLDEIEQGSTGQKSIYLGSAGTLWAMAYLAREGAVDLSIDPRELIAGVHEAYLAEPDTGEVVPSYFLGEVGILLVLWRLKGSREAADRLFDAIDRNIPNPTNEALWAAPGTMVGAWQMLQWTGEARWRELFLANVEHLWDRWLPSEHAPCHLWTQDLYGSVVQLLGAGHGFAGNAYALLRGAALLSAERRRELYERCEETVRVTAVVEEGAANWPPGVGPARPGRTKMLVQWCHGAPGIVTGLADFPPGVSAAILFATSV
jgi:hypothetical protein